MRVTYCKRKIHTKHMWNIILVFRFCFALHFIASLLVSQLVSVVTLTSLHSLVAVFKLIMSSLLLCVSTYTHMNANEPGN